MSNRDKIKWVELQKIRDVANEYVTAGEENELTQEEIARINNAITATTVYMTEIHCLFVTARELNRGKLPMPFYPNGLRHLQD